MNYALSGPPPVPDVIEGDELPALMPLQQPAVPRKWLNMQGNRPTVWDCLQMSWNAYGFHLTPAGTLANMGDDERDGILDDT